MWFTGLPRIAVEIIKSKFVSSFNRKRVKNNTAGYCRYWPLEERAEFFGIFTGRNVYLFKKNHLFAGKNTCVSLLLLLFILTFMDMSKHLF